MRTFVLIIVVLFFANGCIKVSPLETTEESSDADTLFQVIQPGIFLRLDSLKDSYTLDEQLHGIILLYNESYSQPFVVYTGSQPIHSWRVTSPTYGLVSAEPTIIMPGSFRDTLSIGDTIMLTIDWYQYIWSPTEIVSGLKAFAGNYSLHASVSGFGVYKPLYKHFTISEVGEPLSLSFERDYSSPDTIRAFLIVRNRISSPTTLTALQPNPITLTFEQQYHPELGQVRDTLHTEVFEFNTSTTIPAKTDSIVFVYESLPTDPKFSDFTGVITLHFDFVSTKGKYSKSVSISDYF